MSSADAGAAPPPSREVAPGIWSIRQPLSNAMRYVWAYAIELADGVLLVDAGYDEDGHEANLEAGLGLFGASLDDVQGVIFTHFHRDHYGMAGRIRARSGAWLALHEVEARLIAAEVGAVETRRQVERWFEDLGVGAESAAGLSELAVRLETQNRSAARPDRVLADGDVLELGRDRFEIVHTPGHSPGHVCIVERRRGVVFSGDHVLSWTTPNVSIFAGTQGSPLGDYLRSLERVRPLRGLLDLPGHEDAVDIGDRALELLDYHAEQLEAVTALLACGTGTVWELAAALWPEAWAGLAAIDRLLALGEAYAHIAVLVASGRLKLVGRQPFRWQAAAGAP